MNYLYLFKYELKQETKSAIRSNHYLTSSNHSWYWLVVKMIKQNFFINIDENKHLFFHSKTILRRSFKPVFVKIFILLINSRWREVLLCKKCHLLIAEKFSKISTSYAFTPVSGEFGYITLISMYDSWCGT